MASASFFEQLTGSVSLSMMTIVSVVSLALILLATVAFRVFFSSSTKSKSTSSSKQVSNKDKKTKETNPKKQQTETTSASKKKNKPKKNANATPPPPVKAAAAAASSSSSSSSTSQSEESEEEKAVLVAPKKQPSSSNKTSAGKKVAVNDENNKSVNATNGIKTSTTKQQQQQQQVSARTENVDAGQNAEGKKKQVKGNAAPPANKQPAVGKNDNTNKVNANTSNKKQPVVANSEVQRTAAAVDVEAGSDQEDEGQWVTQSSKQVNNRNRNKGKNETSTANNQESPSATSSSNRKTASEKRATATTSANNTSSSTNKTEVDVEYSSPPTPPAAAAPTTTQIQEPIEICQLLPAGEDRYTANDNWWKQALNKPQTLSIDDIGEWPERDQDEQYTVQKRIIPVKNTKALTEKDVNVDGNDEISNYKNEREDEKLNFDNQTNSSSVVAGETKTTATSQTKKRSTNVRRLS